MLRHGILFRSESPAEFGVRGTGIYLAERSDRRITGLSCLPEERRIDMAVSSGILVEVFLMIVFGGIEILQLLDLDCHAAPQFPLQTADTTRDNITVREVCIVYAGTVLEAGELVVLVKETSVISVIAVNDLTKMASFIGSRTWDILPPYIIAAAIYLLITMCLTSVLGYFERRMSQGDHH